MIELKEEEIPILIGRSWALQDRLSREIKGLNNTFSGLCRSCRGPAHCVRVSSNKPFHYQDEQKERLVGIRDSIRDFGHMLSSFQEIGARQRRHQEEVEMRLEESRAKLMELVRQHQGTRAPHIIREIDESFGQRLSPQSISVTRTTNGDCGRRRRVCPRAIWRWLIQVMRVRILIPLVEWKRSMWSMLMRRTLIVLFLSISARKAIEKTTRFRWEGGGGGEDCAITDHTFHIFHGRG